MASTHTTINLLIHISMATLLKTAASPLDSLLLQRIYPALPGLNPKNIYRCDVIFGSPSASCRATGICKIMAYSPTAAKTPAGQCRRTAAAFAPIVGNQGLRLFLFRELLCSDVWKNHLRRGYLELPEPFFIPASLRNHFSLRKIEIPAGLYPWVEMPGYYRIDFRLPA